MFSLKKLCTDAELRHFNAHQQDNIGVPVRQEYLERSDVYGFYYRGQLAGGFVFCNTFPYRLIESFSADEQAKLNDLVAQNSFFEVGCFHLAKDYRKGFVSVLFWMTIAWSIFRRPEKFVLYGCLSQQLFPYYSAARECALLHSGSVKTALGERQAWLLTARTRFVLLGIGEVILYKFFKFKKQKAYNSLILNELFRRPSTQLTA